MSSALERPVCSISRKSLGDHYSIRGEHEKAIKYYRRAVLLDQNCVGAWTLLGHSFVEMKNAHAAIESYRRAIGQYWLTVQPHSQTFPQIWLRETQGRGSDLVRHILYFACFNILCIIISEP